MMYFKTLNGVLIGPFPEEDAIKFNLATIEARLINNSWKVVDGTMWILDFGDSEANARQAVAIIKKYRVHYQCFVGRPHAPMMYFRR